MISSSCSALICPSVTSIAPCFCLSNAEYATRILVDCGQRSLNDLQFSSILDKFLAPGLSPVFEIRAHGNQLTKVPSQISKFPALSSVSFRDNRITAIPYGNGTAFLKNNITNAKIEIRLEMNQISSIPSGAFNFPFASSVSVILSNLNISNAVFPNGAFNFPSASGQIVVALSFNRITAIPSSTVFNFPLASNVEIDFTFNKITSIPCSSQFNFPLANTVRISLDANRISTVPSCAFNFPTATMLYVSLGSNLITTISPGAFNFPSSIYAHLSFYNNSISTIPPNTFSQGNKENIQFLKY